MANPLLQFLNSLTPAQREAFAKAAKSSPTSLRLAANGYKTEGKLNITAEFAARIEKASRNALPRQTLCDTCKKCPHAKNCK